MAQYTWDPSEAYRQLSVPPKMHIALRPDPETLLGLKDQNPQGMS